MKENLERCLKCGKQQGLQGVAVTIGRRTFHLFYLCAKCGNVNIEELLKIINGIKKRGQPDLNPNLLKDDFFELRGGKDGAHGQNKKCGKRRGNFSMQTRI